MRGKKKKELRASTLEEDGCTWRTAFHEDVCSRGRLVDVNCGAVFVRHLNTVQDVPHFICVRRDRDCRRQRDQPDGGERRKHEKFHFHFPDNFFEPPKRILPQSGCGTSGR